MVEITFPVYILGSLTNVFIWTLAWKYYKKTQENQYGVVYTYDPDENIKLIHGDDGRPLV
jgi:hypothetical protein